MAMGLVLRQPNYFYSNSVSAFQSAIR